MISRLLKKIDFFCRIKSLLQGSFAKETYVFREPTNRSHRIACNDVINGVPGCSGLRRPTGYLFFMGHCPQKSPIIDSLWWTEKETCNLRNSMHLRHRVMDDLIEYMF